MVAIGTDNRTITVSAMPEAEARAKTARIRESLHTACLLLAEMHDRQGYRNMGYMDWASYVVGEIGLTVKHVNRQVKAGHVEMMLNGDGTVERLPERVMRPLTRLKDADSIQRAWNYAKEAAGGKTPTAAIVEATVSTMQEARRTGGFVDTGNGTGTALSAAITRQAFETMQEEHAAVSGNAPAPLLNDIYNTVEAAVKALTGVTVADGKALRLVVYATRPVSHE